MLTISGKGATADYTHQVPAAPWQPYSRDVDAIQVKPGVTYLGAFAFRNLTYARTVTLPDTLTAMGHYVFSVSAIASVTLPAGVTNVPDGAFYYCTNLSTVTLPEGLRTIGEGAFKNCSSLREIVLPDGVVSIGKDAFRYSGLSRITIPAGVTSIGEDAFSPGTTIVTTKGSAADAYAKANGLVVEYLP